MGIALSVAAYAGEKPHYTDLREITPSFEGHYASVGYTRFDTEDVDLSVLTGRYGYRFNRHWAVEAELGMGVDDASYTVTVEEFVNDALVRRADAVLSGKVNHTLGAYLVGHIPVNQQIDLFGRAGYQQTTLGVDLSLSGTDMGTPFSFQSDADFDYGGLGLGAGANIQITENSGLRLEYTRLSTEELADDLEAAYAAAGFDADLSAYDSIDTFSLSYVRRF